MASPTGEGDVTVIYETYIASIMMTEQRRSQVSAIYTSILAAAIASIGFFKQINLVYPALSILFLATLWVNKVKFLQSLAGIKWKTALELEKRLIAQPFTEEYAAIKRSRLEESLSTRRLSDFEVLLPRGVQIGAAIYLVFQFVLWASAAEWQFWKPGV